MKMTGDAIRVWILTSTHEKILKEKARQGGKNLPYVVEELIDLGLAYKKILSQTRTNG